MSLCVDVFVRDEDGGRRVLDVPEGCQDSAGFERWRTTVRGSETVRAPGARFLPVPATGDLHVEAEDVTGFLAEVALLRANLEPVATGTERPRGLPEHRDGIAERVDIIEAAALRAREQGAGVLIW
ncbi:hypothetical protein ACIPSE_09375 [Streptomyces sp. NPDC090106]|uniref:hypothetical protein n=1 Tax=Streptomyces sp. NPDC090106 TaxID=3365946 RepID=UPI0037FF8402